MAIWVHSHLSGLGYPDDQGRTDGKADEDLLLIQLR
jgi:hypothetical protein